MLGLISPTGRFPRSSRLLSALVIALIVSELPALQSTARAALRGRPSNGHYSSNRIEDAPMGRKSPRTHAKASRWSRSIERLEPRLVFSTSPTDLPLLQHGALDEPADPLAEQPAQLDTIIPPVGLHQEQPLTNFLWQPMVYAGADAQATTGEALQLNAEVLVNRNVDLSIEWRLVSGPGNATFGDSTNVNSTVQFDGAGAYELELVATNSGIVVSDHILVNVEAANIVNIDQAWLDAQGEGPYTLTQAGATYRLQVDVTTPGTAFYIANRDIVFDLNGHTIHYGGVDPDYAKGVVLYLGFHNTEIVIPGAQEAFNAVVRNGTIINDGAGLRAHGIYGYRGHGLTVENMQITTDGEDSATVYLRYNGEGITRIVDSILTTNTASTGNRHSGPANVWVSNSQLHASGNVLIGGNSAFTVGSDSVITQNVMAHSAFATNGYGVWLYRNDGVTITDNLILPTNGRGILFNAGEGHIATGNVILHMSEPNAEFGGNLNPPAVRSRYETSGITYSNNTSLGIGGGSLTSASSLYLSNYEQTSPNEFSNNHATTILVGTPSINQYAQPLTMEGTGRSSEYANPTDDISGNTFRSNYTMIRTEGYDGFVQQETPLTNNSFEWVDGSAAYQDFSAAIAAKLAEIGLTGDVLAAANQHIGSINANVEALIGEQGLQENRATWHVKYISHDGEPSYMTVLDSNWGEGVDPRDYTFQYSNNSSGSVTVLEGFTQEVQLLSGGVPVANATVSVSTAQGDNYEVTTDVNGRATLTFYRFSIEKENPVGAPFAVVERTESTVSVGASSVTIDHANVPTQVELGAGLNQSSLLAPPDDSSAGVAGFVTNGGAAHRREIAHDAAIARLDARAATNSSPETGYIDDLSVIKATKEPAAENGAVRLLDGYRKKQIDESAQEESWKSLSASALEEDPWERFV